MEVTLFLGFGVLLMLKVKSQKPQLWGFSDQRGPTQYPLLNTKLKIYLKITYSVYFLFYGEFFDSIL